MDAELSRLESELTAALAGLTANQTQATPTAQPEKWSIQQIVDHLLKTYKATIPVIQTRIDKRSPTKAAPTMQQRVGQFVLIGLGQFPRGRQSPAAVAPSLPASLRSGAELSERVRAELGELDGVIGRGEHLFGGRRAASHMVLGPLSMPQWRRFHRIHGLHHVKQIKAIRRDHGF